MARRPVSEEVSNIIAISRYHADNVQIINRPVAKWL
jgi:hypothetical protein